MKIQTKLHVLVALPLLGLAILAVTLWSISSTLRSLDRDHGDARRVSEMAHAIVSDACDLRLASGDELDIEPLRRRHAELTGLVQGMEAGAGEDSLLLTPVRSKQDAVSEALAALAAAPAERVAGRADELLIASRALAAAAEELDVSRAKRRGRVADSVSRWALGVLFLTCLGATTTAVLLARSAIRPIRRLESGVRHLANGEFSFRTGIVSEDEIGKLSNAFDEMAERIQQTTIGLGEAEEQARVLERLEDTLDQTEHRSELIFAMSMDGIVEMGTDGLVSNANDAFCRMTGYTRGELVKMNLREVLPETARRDFDAQIDHVRESGQHKFDTELLARSGDTADVEVSVSLCATRGDEFLVVFVRDVSESRRARQALTQHRDQLMAIMESFPELLHVSDPATGELLFVNHVHKELFGEEAIERKDEEYITALNGRGGSSWEYHSARLDRDFIVRDMTIPWPGRDAVEMQLAVDVTLQKRAERELQEVRSGLERTNAELQQFAYVASHDLQEPLRKIRAFGDRLVARLGDDMDEKAADYLGRMQDASGRMQQLIEDLLAFSRISTRGHAFKPTDLGAELAGVLRDMEVVLSETGAQVDAGELPTIDCDGTQMRQLFQNLLSNSVKFRKPDESPQISIQAETYRRLGHDMCVLTVSDNGIGFDQKYEDRIFTVFQRLHARTEYPGTGIGLAVCRKIVRRHGGEIAVRSKSGDGATFMVTLPVHQHETVEARAE